MQQQITLFQAKSENYSIKLKVAVCVFACQDVFVHARISVAHKKWIGKIIWQILEYNIMIFCSDLYAIQWKGRGKEHALVSEIPKVSAMKAGNFWLAQS